MSKIRTFVAGLLFGGIITGTGAAFADSEVTVKLMSAVKFTFNGVEKKLPDGYAVLEYQDHMYVPARFVAEEFGARVQWDGSTSTVSMRTGESYKPFLLDSNFLKTAEQGQVLGIEWKIGGDFHDVFQKWPEPFGSGMRDGAVYYDYPQARLFKDKAMSEIIAIEIQRERLQGITPADVTKALGTPDREEISVIDDMFTLHYTAGDYELYFKAQNKDANIEYFYLKHR
ncbi:MAG: DUF4309 domain-containing protein [Tumebacillaceae bacterium]